MLVQIDDRHYDWLEGRGTEYADLGYRQSLLFPRLNFSVRTELQRASMTLEKISPECISM